MLQWYMPQQRIVATNPGHLKECVELSIRLYGPKCDLNHIDVSGISDFTGLFSNSEFDGDISQWDVRQMRRSNSMFFSCPFNGDISNWETNNLRIAIGMFRLSQFNGDLSRWNTSNLYNTSSMFGTCAFEGDISQWDISAFQNCERMFVGSKCKSDLSTWVLPSKCKYTWMFNEKFEGTLPRLPDLTGISSKYGKMFGEHAALREFLVKNPFSHVHATLLMELKTKPVWATTAQFKKVKATQEMARSLGLRASETHGCVMAALSLPSPAQTIALDGLLDDTFQSPMPE